MAVDPRLLEQVLNTPETRDVTESPIVTAVILSDPANAADLVPALEPVGSTRSKNARRILCLFGADSVRFLLSSVAGASSESNKEAIDVMWAILTGEDKVTIRTALAQVSDELDVLLNDKRPLPDAMPAFIERDFVGRICDLAYGVLCYLDDPEYDRSLFRSMDDDARDAEIRRYRGRFLSLS
jgi:hypothetical protein